jgi:hypothetical protein
MSRIVHLLPQRTRSRNWIVRTEGVSDVILGSELQAEEFGRVVAQRIANSTGKTVLLRKWVRFGPHKDEVFNPDFDPLRDAWSTRRKKAA